jgi:hypothetical protein
LKLVRLSELKSVKAWGAVVVTALALFGLGCGSGGDSGSTGSGESVTVTTNSGMTKAELIAQGDKICEKTDKVQEEALKAYLKENPKAASSAAGKNKMVSVAGIPPIQTELEDLVALGSPAGEEDEVQAIFDSIQQALEKGEEDPGALISESNNFFKKADALAGKYGFKACDQAL